MKRAEGVPDVLKIYQKTYRPLVLAIAGDQTQHLLYRMPLELPSCPLDAIFLVLIGTNNLGAGYSIESTTRGIMAVVDWLLLNTPNRLVLLNLLPRGGRRQQRSLLGAVKEVNRAVEGEAQNRSQRLSFSKCGDFFQDKSGKISEDLMPDRLHPNDVGHAKLAHCLLQTVL